MSGGVLPASVRALAAELAGTGWVTDLLAGGSLATGDYRPGISDLDLVAVVEGPVDAERREVIARLHQGLDEDAAAGLQLGCVYVSVSSLVDLGARHTTWTHGRLVDRPLTGIARAELVRHGFAVTGRAPAGLLPAMSDDEVRAAARAELTGYWATAVRRPWWWLDASLADLGLVTMARARHTLRTGQLLTKTAALDLVDAPAWLVADLRARREGGDVRSPRFRAAWLAWSDARRTVRGARRG